MEEDIRKYKRPQERGDRSTNEIAFRSGTAAKGTATEAEGTAEAEAEGTTKATKAEGTAEAEAEATEATKAEATAEATAETKEAAAKSRSTATIHAAADASVNTDVGRRRSRSWDDDPCVDDGCGWRYGS